MFILIGQIQITQINHITSRDPMKLHPHPCQNPFPTLVKNVIQFHPTIHPTRFISSLIWLMDHGWVYSKHLALCIPYRKIKHSSYSYLTKITKMDATISLSTLNMKIVISIDFGHSVYCKEFFIFYSIRRYVCTLIHFTPIES